ncbi:MAG: N-acetylneuraminate synthase family protein [Chthoniobacter sp.]|nr:N-acetylneuraminate synthase family protein [Chthoniobacter sp.]
MNFISHPRIGPRIIGPGQPVFIIAEAGVNHNGDLAMAHRLIDAAADAGADAVKFQTFDTERLVSARASKAGYQIENTGAPGSQLEMLRRLELTADMHRELIAHAATRGLIFLSTPFDETCADLLHSLEVPAFKVSSGDLTNLPFLAHLARTGRPVLLSTGMSFLHEVEEAVRTIAAAGGTQLVLFHCVSDYPAMPEHANLRSMAALVAINTGPVGFSDHTLGAHVAHAAVALGATSLEKHLTLDKTLPGPDHLASLDPAEFRAYVATVRDVEAALGDGVKRPLGPEIGNIITGRRSLHWTRDLPAGAKIAAGDVIALRPVAGMPPGARDGLMGQTLARAAAAGEPVQEEDFSA